MLVMVYFLHHLARRHDFTVDFAHPVDATLSRYLQSAECIEALAWGGGLFGPSRRYVRPPGGRHSLALPAERRVHRPQP
jgi:hypothetical protein